MFGNAEAYERFMGRWSRLVAPLLVDFADIQDSGRILDIGSGVGSLAFAVAESKINAYVLGIDRSKEYVEYAKQRNLFLDRVVFEHGDAQQLPFPDSTFQGSLSLLVFNFISDGQKALRETCRITKPGGRISAAVWDYGAGMGMLRVFWDAAVHLDARARQLDERNAPLCRPGELGRLWRQAGLKDVYEAPIDIIMQFQSFADYWDPFLLAQGPAGAYAGSIQPQHLQALRDEVKRRLLITHEEVLFELPARAWAVRGTVPSQGR